MSDTGHALISPSAAKQWIACPRSIRLGEGMENKSSSYADEGTLAHRIAELTLKKRFGQISALEFLREMDKCLVDPLWSKAMEKHVDDYCDFVCERYAIAKASDSAAIILIEVRIDLCAIIPNGYGFTDCIIIANGLMEQIDLKYGQGVKVSAEKNEQQSIYAWGALADLSFLYDVKQVRVTIYQPRMNNVNDWITTPSAIEDFILNVVKPAAKLAHAGQGEFNPGSHCQFCRARPACRALYDFNMKIAQEDFKPADILTDDEIAEVLLKAEIFTGWIKAIKDYALSTAIQGRKWPGFKIVNGESKRMYHDPKGVIKALTEDAFYGKDEISVRAPLGLTKMKEVIGADNFEKYVVPFITKPEGALTLVPLDDKRPAFDKHSQAIKDFAE